MRDTLGIRDDDVFCDGIKQPVDVIAVHHYRNSALTIGRRPSVAVGCAGL